MYAVGHSSRTGLLCHDWFYDQLISSRSKQMQCSLEQQVEEKAEKFLEDDGEDEAKDENFPERNDNFPPGSWEQQRQQPEESTAQHITITPTCTRALTEIYAYTNSTAFSALTLFVGSQEEHPAGINWAMGCWRGYLSGARCRLFAYGPAKTTAIPKLHHLLPRLNPDWF